VGYGVGDGGPAWAATANLNGAHTQIDLIAALTVLGASLLLSVGIRESSRVNVIFVIIQILSMLVFLVVAVPFVRATHFMPFHPTGFSGILASTSLVFFAYIGFDTVTVASEEAHEPHRNVPIGIIVSLVVVAAILTLVGYSVNDTIVVFDRIREVRGKNPDLTPQMINDSVNQTLSRTLLTSFSVWLVVFVLYVFGGEGVHLFAFVMVVGVIVGTYSSIYIASPLLLMFGEGRPAEGAARKPTPEPEPEAAPDEEEEEAEEEAAAASSEQITKKRPGGKREEPDERIKTEDE